MLLIMKDFVRRNPDKREPRNAYRGVKAAETKLLSSRVARVILKDFWGQ